MASTDAKVFPVIGEAYRLYGTIISSATGNPITGGLTGVAATISKDGASFASTTNSPVEIGTTGKYYLELTAAEMNATSVWVSVAASNTNAVYDQACIITVPSSTEVPTAAEVATAVWDTALYSTPNATPGTMGKALSLVTKYAFYRFAKTGNNAVLYDADGTTSICTLTMQRSSNGKDFDRAKAV